MNRLEFLVRKAAAKLGAVAPRRYLRNATEESILLKEAETLIGKMAWRDLEHVEELTNEYWRIRQLDAEQTKIEEEIEAATAEMKRIQEAAQTPETQFATQLERIGALLEFEREKLTEKLKATQEVIHAAEAVRKKFNGLKLKLSVLKGEEADNPVLEGVRQELQETKNKYGELAREVEDLRGETRLSEKKIKAIEAEMDNLRGRISLRERNLTRELSDAGRRLMELNSRLGILGSEKNELYSTIGHLLRIGNDTGSEAYRDVRERFAPIIQQARALDKSIELNRRLADFR
jgi:chromosome segregation ATPase